MTEHLTNAERLARLEEKIDGLREAVGAIADRVGKHEDKLAGLVDLKNKGWGFIVGLLIFAGAVGAGLKSAIGDLLK